MSFLNETPRHSLGFFPTPLVELKRLAATLGGPRIFIKRDDQTGLAFGGNKTRKLEFLLGEALQQGADTLVTGGAAQSNHCRQTAAAAKVCGLDCHLVLGGEAPDHLEGNLLLDRLFAAAVHWAGEFRKGETIPQVVDSLKSQGKRPYLVPYGGSNATGALGFVVAVSELKIQLQKEPVEFSHILFASSSGGTHAGLMAGAALYGLEAQLLGIAIEKEEMSGTPMQKLMLDLANGTADRLGLESPFTAEELHLLGDYTGAGYGVVGELEAEAIKLLAEQEGILLDPVYTGRAFGALVDMVRKGKFDSSDCILFWHTGGAPALFSYADELKVSV